jgi:transcriptional regulator with XRE-family HTH domain
LDSQLLGTRIRKAREERHITQEQLAHAVSKDQRAISEYESGKRRLSAVDLPDFSRALGVSILYFYEDEIQLDDVDHEMLVHLHELPTQEAKQSAIDLVRILSSSLQQHSR